MEMDKETAEAYLWKGYLFGSRPSDFLLGDELADGIDTVILNQGFEQWLNVMQSIAAAGIKM